MPNYSPTLGLALSGSGNRTCFYVGFLEVFEEQHIKIDYIAACSGGSLVAAAYACGSLPEFKEKILNLDKEALKTYLIKKQKGGGLYSSQLFEEEIRRFTKGSKFEEVRPLMGFVAVDIESGEKVVLSIGDIAHAAIVSCTLPGIFEPAKWGDKTLVDGGLLTMVPGDILKQVGMDVTVGINMRGTRHIFTQNIITGKKIYNFFKKILFVEEISGFIGSFWEFDDVDFSENPGMFTVIGKSLDLAIAANNKNNLEEESCDLIIAPEISAFKKNDFAKETLYRYYQEGRKAALANLPTIKKMLLEKKHKLEKV